MPLINGTLQDEHKEQIQSYSFTLVVPLVCLFAFFIGLPSNLLAFWVLLFRTKKHPSTILLINLTICDLLLLLVLPFRIIYHFLGNNWTFGEPFCRVVIGLLYGNMYGSVVCLALIAVDRYIALVHPFGAKMFRMICSCLVDASQVKFGPLCSGNSSNRKRGCDKTMEQAGLCFKLFYVKPISYFGTLKKGQKIGTLLPMQKVYPGITSHVHVQMCDRSDPTKYF
ncbi:hypothetical protein cypCar_00003541 [Cyprinus carpio]|nr:hypothetical protein cypCar_00003541 [Cyprinus carpio]